jgi:transcriptional regulator with XRE-family HTH domain
MHASKLLARHIDSNKLSLRAFAEKVGTSASLVWRWRNGDGVPGIAFALRIAEVTGGLIKPEDWLDRPRARQQRRERAGRKATHPQSVKRSSQH